MLAGRTSCTPASHLPRLLDTFPLIWKRNYQAPGLAPELLALLFLYAFCAAILFSWGGFSARGEYYPAGAVACSALGHFSLRFRLRAASYVLAARL